MHRFGQQFTLGNEVVIITLDSKERILKCNDELKKVMGYEAEKLSGQHYSALCADNNQDDKLSRAKKKGFYEDTDRFLRLNGDVFQAQTTYLCIAGEQEEVLSYVLIIREITSRDDIRQDHRLQKAYFRQLFDNTPEGIVIMDVQGRIVASNKFFQQLFMFAPHELEGRKVDELIVPYHLLEESKKFTWHGLTGNKAQTETVRMRKDGQLIDVIIFISPILVDDKQVGLYGLFRDVSGRKHQEKVLMDSIREKEVLLQEIHHRVKNNMQIISSLHALQARQINDEVTRALFKESQNRIQSMALIHDQLYQSSDLARLNFTEYLQKLVIHLFDSFGNDQISYSLKADPVYLNINSAVPCGLIVNELITNSLKHAFQEDSPGRISISLQETPDKILTLSIEDDGRGLPDSIDFRSTETLGLQLVIGLVSQIKGEMYHTSEKGTCFTIRFRKNPIKANHPEK